MKAAVWCGKKSVHVEDVKDPELLSARDAVIRVTLTAICGSDLHLYDGYIPTMRPGDILGHEMMGEVVEVGGEVKNLRKGDRVVVPFTIACGSCFFCQKQLHSLCDNTNPGAYLQEAAYGEATAGIFGYSHMLGGYAGGQAQYARIPFADVGPIKVPQGMKDEEVLFLSDIFPTGYQAADHCDIQEGDIVGVWGCGPVGQMAIRSALMLGAEKVIAIDHYSGRLRMAEGLDRVRTVNFDDVDVYEQVMDLTAGRGPDACIDAVGLEAHGTTVDALYDRVKVATYAATDRIHALRQMVRVCRKGGTLSLAGVYGGIADKFPIGAIFGKALQLRCGQTHMQRYLSPLLERIQKKEIDPSFVITHRFPLTQAKEAYELFSRQKDDCIKVVLDPAA